MLMVIKSASFERSLAVGLAAESQIAKWLISKGYCVMPAYEKIIDEGKGPQIFCADGELVAPDLQAFNGKRTMWVEAKQKSVFSWHRLTNRWVTGIDLRHYEHYQEVGRKSGWPVWLLFLHTSCYSPESPHNCPSGLFGQELSYLRDHENHRSDKWGKSGMVYWAVESLKHLAPVNAEGKIV